jgi:hypothetical protein
MSTTYRKFSQEVIDAHYNGMPLPEAAITQRFVAEWVAMLVAKAAVKSAFVSSNAMECTYANDQFISVFYNCPLLTDSVTGDKYATMPATPAGLPKMREIAQISFVGSPGLFVVPEDNKDEFIESQLPPLPTNIILFKVEGGNIVFPRLPKIINSPVNMKLVGAVPPGATILDSVLNIPKDVEEDIRAAILNGLALDYKIQPVNLQVGEPS